MDSQAGFRPTPQLVLGLIAVAAGVLFLLDNMNIIAAYDFLRFWPLGIIALGLAIAFESSRSPGHMGGVILIAIGSLLLLNNLHVIHFRFRYLIPIILVLFGANMIWRAFARERSITDAEKESVSAIAVLGGVKKTPVTQDFRGGEFTALLGGCEIDLRSASMQTDQAVVNVLAFWGGIELKVPENWSVDCKGIPILGGFEEHTQHPANGSAKRLVIKGFAIMGGVEIKN